MSTITRTTLYQTLNCSACGVPFAIADAYMAERREDHKTFYCPNGHTQYYPHETDAEKATRRAERAESKAATLTARNDQLEMSRRAYKGQVTKIKRRVANGVCPCCSRTFADVARHMKSQHPDFEDAS